MTNNSSKSQTPLRVVLTRIGEPSLAAYGATRMPLDTPLKVSDFWREQIAKDEAFEGDKEHLVAILTDSKFRPTAYHIVSVGGLNEAIAHPREILRAAVIAGAYGFILCHNHPSGDSTPSEADRRVTVRVRDAAELLQIKLIDHVVVGEGTHHSFREDGLI